MPNFICGSESIEFTKLIGDYIALYVCLVGVGYLHDRLFGPLFEDRTWITDNLPSRVYGIETSISMSLNRRFAPECQDEADQSCSLLVEMTRQDEKHLYSHVSVSSFLGIVGYPGAHAATPSATQALTFAVTCEVSLYYKNWDMSGIEAFYLFTDDMRRLVALHIIDL
jgi:hypothetical protein